MEKHVNVTDAVHVLCATSYGNNYPVRHTVKKIRLAVITQRNMIIRQLKQFISFALQLDQA